MLHIFKGLSHLEQCNTFCPFNFCKWFSVVTGGMKIVCLFSASLDRFLSMPRLRKILEIASHGSELLLVRVYSGEEIRVPPGDSNVRLSR